MTARPAPARAVVAAYRERYGEAPHWLVRAPGRVNLIGEYTDFNEGFVLPVAIDRAVWVAAGPRAGREVEVLALDVPASATFDLDRLTRDAPSWVEYLKGCAWALQEQGHALAGWQGVVAGDVPAGAGLSSSAALELATLRAFALAGNLPWSPTAMARLGQRAENGWVGVACGIMDQMISAAGESGHALLIDCRSLTLEPVPLPRDVRVVILDSATRRGLVDSAYNERRAQCEAAARALGVGALRDATLAMLERAAGHLEAVVHRRARHVISENDRTLQAAAALRAGDATAVGALMDSSHASLRDDLEVSTPALDALVTVARGEPGCLGARMTGAGFGGCAVALVTASHIDAFAEAVRQKYRTASGREAMIYVSQAAGGVAVEPVAPHGGE